MAMNVDTSKGLGAFDINNDVLFNDEFIQKFSKLVNNYFEKSSSEEEKLLNTKELINELVKHLNSAFDLGFSDEEVINNLIYKDKIYSSVSAAYASGKNVVFSNEVLKNWIKNDELSQIFNTVIHEFTHVAQNIKFPEHVGVARAYNFFDETSKDKTHSILINHFSKKLIINLNEFKHSKEFMRKTIKIVDKLKDKYKSMPTMIKFTRDGIFNIVKDFDDYSSRGIRDSIYYESDKEKEAYFLGSYLAKQLSKKIEGHSSDFKKVNAEQNGPFENWLYTYQQKSDMEGKSDFWRFIKYLTPKEFVKILQKNYEVNREEFNNLYIKVLQSKDSNLLENETFDEFIKNFNACLIDIHVYAKDESARERILKSAVVSDCLDLAADLMSEKVDKAYADEFILKAFKANREDLFVKNHGFFKYFTEEQNSQFLNWLKNNTNPRYLNLLSPFYSSRTRGFDADYGNFNKTVENREGENSLFDEAFLQSFKKTVKQTKQNFKNLKLIDVERIELSELQNNFIKFRFNCDENPKEYAELVELNQSLLNFGMNMLYESQNGIQPS